MAGTTMRRMPGRLPVLSNGKGSLPPPNFAGELINPQLPLRF
jgi:hypothetical protein